MRAPKSPLCLKPIALRGEVKHVQVRVNLLHRIAPPDMVVSDGGQGFRSAVK